MSHVPLTPNIECSQGYVTHLLLFGICITWGLRSGMASTSKQGCPGSIPGGSNVILQDRFFLVLSACVWGISSLWLLACTSSHSEAG